MDTKELTANTNTKFEKLPLLEQIVILRTEIDAFNHTDYPDLKGVVIGKMKQTFSNFIFWYKQWDKNRDYSSVVNASLALGKVNSVFDMWCVAVENNAENNELASNINFVCSKCWENICAATGRITPFEE